MNTIVCKLECPWRVTNFCLRPVIRITQTGACDMIGKSIEDLDEIKKIALERAFNLGIGDDENADTNRD